MTALTEFLFPAPAKRTTGAILKWWESRRLPYNLIVGTSGLLSIGVVRVLAWLPPDAMTFRMTWWPIVTFGVLANIFYLLGPMVEVAIEKLGRGSVLPTGPVLYRMGLTFAVGLTLLPTLIFFIVWIARIVGAIF